MCKSYRIRAKIPLYLTKLEDKKRAQLKERVICTLRVVSKEYKIKKGKRL